VKGQEKSLSREEEATIWQANYQLRSRGFGKCLPHACLEWLNRIRGHFLNQPREFLGLLGEGLELLTRVRGRYLKELGRRFHTKQPVNEVERGVGVGVDQLNSVALLVTVENVSEKTLLVSSAVTWVFSDTSLAKAAPCCANSRAVPEASAFGRSDLNDPSLAARGQVGVVTAVAAPPRPAQVTARQASNHQSSDPICPGMQAAQAREVCAPSSGELGDVTAAGAPPCGSVESSGRGFARPRG
jgi:hypothetical protein